MNKKQWLKENIGKENKNWAYHLLNIITLPVRMTFVICPVCHELVGDLSPCSCMIKEWDEEKRRRKEWKLGYDTHCVWCSTADKKQELTITKLEEYGHDGYDFVGWSSKCPKCKKRSYTSGGRTIPKKVRELYNKQKIK